MSLRVCTQPGCPTLVRSGRCKDHERERDRERGTRQERGYDARHDRLRANYQRRMDRGQRFRCWRCGNPIDPSDWTLGHCDTDRIVYHGPECPPCDYATAGRTGCPHHSHVVQGVGVPPSGSGGDGDRGGGASEFTDLSFPIQTHQKSPDG